MIISVICLPWEDIKLRKEWVAQNIFEIAQRSSSLTWPRPSSSIQVLVDYASPNMCKELHVGHLRSAVLGESLSRILEYIGHHVERVSHVGDFGTPIGLVLAQAIDTGASFTKDPTLFASPSELSHLYVQAKKRSDSDVMFAKRAQELVVQLQRKIGVDSNDLLVQMYNSLCTTSRISFNQIYKKLNITGLKEQGESFYANMLAQVVKELKDKNIAVEDHGATCIFVPGFKAPFIIEKSDGGYLYATTDLAALQYRIKQGKQWIIYVTDESQKQHFQQLFKVAMNTNWLDPPCTARLDHIGFGVVKGSDGHKLSSRDGTPLTLLGLLDDSVKEAARVLQEQRQRGNSLVSSDEEGPITEAIAYNAIKYFDLCHPRDYVFSFQQMLSMKGNTAVYLLYAITRINSLKAKRSGSSSFAWKEPPVLHTEEEQLLAKSIIHYHDTIKLVERTLSPHYLCEYLYDVASKFHLFYDKCRIIGDPLEESRVQLCIAVEKILHNGVQLLGLKTITKM